MRSNVALPPTTAPDGASAISKPTGIVSSTAVSCARSASSAALRARSSADRLHQRPRYCVHLVDRRADQGDRLAAGKRLPGKGELLEWQRDQACQMPGQHAAEEEGDGARQSKQQHPVASGDFDQAGGHADPDPPIGQVHRGGGSQDGRVQRHA